MNNFDTMPQPEQDDSNELTLVVKDRKEFRASRNVLSAASPFISALLDSDTREAKEGIIRLEHISETVMRDVLEFMHSGSVNITPTNARDLIEAADHLLLPSLKTTAGRFLGQKLTISNCIFTYYFAERYHCEELVANARKFISSNFASVAESGDFLNLESQQVEQWISSDDIFVTQEDDVLKIVLKWIEHSKSERKGKLEDLLRHVRLAFVTRDYLKKDVVTNHLVRENSSCLNLVKTALKGIHYSSDNGIQQPPRNVFAKEAIFVHGGTKAFCYLPAEDTWHELPGPWCERKQQMISFQDKLYVVQASPSSEFSAVERYDPSFNRWGSLDWKLSKPATSLKLVVLGDEIYSVDNLTSTREVSVEKFNVESNAWERGLSTLPFQVLGACVVAMDNYLYVISGRWERQESQTHGFKASNSAGRYDTVENRWEQIAEVQEARWDACGVAAHGKIFIAGGAILPQFIHTCEVYDASTNEWQFIASLRSPRTRASMLCIEGTLYVVGGVHNFGRFSFPLSIEYYDFEKNKWKKKTKVPANKLLSRNKNSVKLKACVQRVFEELISKPTLPASKGAYSRFF